MTISKERIIIEATSHRGFADSDYTRLGYLVGVCETEGYKGGGWDRHKGIWVVLSDIRSGELFQAQMERCREVTAEEATSA